MEVTCENGSLFAFKESVNTFFVSIKRGIYEKTGKTTGVRNRTDITSDT